jgi:hypothetical protein
MDDKCGVSRIFHLIGHMEKDHSPGHGVRLNERFFGRVTTEDRPSPIPHAWLLAIGAGRIVLKIG